MSVRVKDCIALIRLRGGLKEWTDGQIAVAINQSVKDLAITYTTDKFGKLTGIVFGKWESPETFYVYYATGCLLDFKKHYKEIFPACKQYRGQRGDEVVTYQL